MASHIKFVFAGEEEVTVVEESRATAFETTLRYMYI